MTAILVILTTVLVVSLLLLVLALASAEEARDARGREYGKRLAAEARADTYRARCNELELRRTLRAVPTQRPRP